MKKERFRPFTKKETFINCPICSSIGLNSDYLKKVFKDPKTLWLANMITHYRHDHTAYDRTWGRNSYGYRNLTEATYEIEKAKYNERAKRQIIRKAAPVLNEMGITAEHFKRLQGTTEETLKVANKYLTQKELV